MILSDAQRERMACFASALKFGVTTLEGSTAKENPENFVNVQTDVETMEMAVATAIESTTAACVEKRKLPARGRYSSGKRSFPAIQSGS